MFQRLINLLSKGRKNKTNSRNVQTEDDTADIQNNVQSSTSDILLSASVNEASGLYESIHSSFGEDRYPPRAADSTRHNPADSPALSELSNTAQEGSKSIISDAFWSKLLKIQSNFQKTSEYYENSTKNGDAVSSDASIISIVMGNNSSFGLSHDDNQSESTKSKCESTLPNEINTSDVSFTDDGLKQSTSKVSLSYMVTLNLLQVEKEFIHHLTALQKFRNVLVRSGLSNEQEIIMFQNMDELGVISELCADELRVILNNSQGSNVHLDNSDVISADVQFTVEDIYDACFTVFREAHDSYRHGLEKALALCKELRRSSSSLFSDVMTEHRFDLLTYLLISPTCHPMNIATALQEVQRASSELNNLEDSALNNEHQLNLFETTLDDMPIAHRLNSKFIGRDLDETYIVSAEDPENTYMSPVVPDNTYLSPINPDATYMCQLDPDNVYLSPINADNTCTYNSSSLDSDILYLCPVFKEDEIYFSHVDEGTILSISSVSSNDIYLSQIDPELINRSKFLAHYQQQGDTSSMCIGYGDRGSKFVGQLDRASKFKRDYILTSSRRDYVRNRFRSTNVYISLVEDM